MTGKRRGAFGPAVLLAVACAGLLAGCSRRAAVHVVEIRGLQFRPPHLVVAPGDTVVWLNHDVVPHTTTALDHSWASPTIASDSSWRTVLTAPGVHPYTCTLHTNMHADIEMRKS